MSRNNLLNPSSFTNENNFFLNLNELVSEEYPQITIPQDIDANLLIEGSFAGLLTIFIGENTKIKISLACFEEFKTTNLQLNLAQNADVEFAFADFGYGSAQVTILFNLNGAGAKAVWKLSSRAQKSDRKNFVISFDHNADDTLSDLRSYGVVTGTSQLKFTGTSHIKEEARRAVAHQTAKIMVFDEKCIAQAEPILKIDHNDVIASHAATVGKVNDNHLFYLCSRGLSVREAKSLITLGYLKPIINSFTDSSIQERISKLIEEQEAHFHD